MKTTRTSTLTKNRAIVLTIAGIITAIFCALAFINDTYPTGNEESVSIRLIKTSSITDVSAFVTPVSKIMDNHVLSSISPK